MAPAAQATIAASRAADLVIMILPMFVAPIMRRWRSHDVTQFSSTQEFLDAHRQISFGVLMIFSTVLLHASP